MMPRAILEYLVLNGSIREETIKKKFGINATFKSKKTDWRGKYQVLNSPDLRFFTYYDPNQNYWYTAEASTIFYLPTSVRELIAPLLFPEPLRVSGYHSDPNQTGEKMFLGESSIQEELPGLLIRLQQKPLKLTQKGKPSIASMRSIAKKLKIQEFHPDSTHSDLKLIRTSSLIGLLALSEDLNTENSIELIKKLFDFEFIHEFHLAVHMLSYIKGVSRIQPYYLPNCGAVYKNLIRGLPLGEWMSYEDIERSLKSQLFSASPIDASELQGLSFEIPYQEDRYSTTRSVRVAPFWLERMIVWPALRAALFIFASWGILDIIYEEPNLAVLSKTADSPYDGIKAIRLNDLGAYVLGLTKSYESKIKAPFTLELAEDSLSILLTDGDQERAAMAISSFAKPFGSKRFYTDAKLFLGDCKNPTDLDHKIRIFTSIFSDKLPPKWQTFFDEISQKVNPIEEDSDYTVFRLDQDNHSLLQLIVRDPELKRLCLKAEGFLILIANKDIKRFRKRLQTFGYLLE